MPDTQIRHTSSFSPRTEAEQAAGNSFPNLRLEQDGEALISSASGDVLQSIQEVTEPPATPKVVELDEAVGSRRRSNAGSERSSDNGTTPGGKDTTLGVANESTIHQWLSLQADQTADLSKMLIAASPNITPTPASSQANLPIVVESINGYGTIGESIGDVVSPEQVKAEERPIQTIGELLPATRCLVLARSACYLLFARSACYLRLTGCHSLPAALYSLPAADETCFACLALQRQRKPRLKLLQRRPRRTRRPPSHSQIRTRSKRSRRHSDSHRWRRS